MKSYLGPFIMTFAVVMFILLMQFVWKYIDDFVGKGLDWFLILELMFYVAVTLVPMALPLAILLASIMTFGNLAESYELTALKSSGMSLQKVMKPLIITTGIMAIGAFLFANFVLPVANLKMGTLLYDITHQKPSLDIKEGVFYNGIQDFTIKVAKKDAKKNILYNILIYDHTQRQGNNKVVMAKEGRMKMSADENFLLITLKDGHSYEEVVSQNNKGFKPLTRTSFKEETIVMDMRDFKMIRTDESLFKDNYQMMNIAQLSNEIDTLKKENEERKFNIIKQVNKNFNLFSDTIVQAENYDSITTLILNQKNWLMIYNADEQKRIFENALNLARTNQSYMNVNTLSIKNAIETESRYKIEWHKKFTLSFACLVLFFIGAPLGAIIRKGGIGMPAVVSVCFFLIFHVLSITGEKSAKEGVWEAWQGAWMATIILLPIGIFLTYKATKDSALFDLDAYLNPLKKIFLKKNNESTSNLQ
ncbi:MAG TPA: LptF/LptG family permease [Bacteroidia bacterium]|nr:LptF/LptG family permease [Bacteroidia bacterium]